MSTASLSPVTVEVNALDIRPIGGRLGAEIRGVDLRDRLSDRIIANIRQALLQYKVIFFRNQSLDDRSQVAFARRFGDITAAHPTVPSLPDNPAILDIDYGRTPARTNFWHTDVTFVDKPPLGSILRAIELPPIGGDTLWANTVTAYKDLPHALQNLANELWAVHSNAYDYATFLTLSAEAKARQEQFSSTPFEALHPVVRVHPETQERSLFIGGFVRRIHGLSTTESAQVLQMLQSYVVRPENTLRWHWQLGDVAFWDNRATQHYGVYDYDGQLRRMQRVTLVGDLPVGLDGRSSQVLQGNSDDYNKLSVLAS
ncbi:MAG TPA: TauD/TfdA family dioxygenase [Phormidium sp.]